MDNSLLPPLVVIVGPTAVGKTKISLQLAERLDGEIISADSRLFYRGMDIGTAKPAKNELARVAHHLIDVAEPDQIWSLAVFQKAALTIIADVHRRGKLPFLVGGTGQYVRAVTHGWTPPAAGPDPRLRAVLEALACTRGKEWLFTKLAILDPDAATRIDPRNLRRTIRAIEVILKTGRRFSEQSGRGTAQFRLIIIGLSRPRSELYDRIDKRIEAMFSTGFLEEVRALLNAGYSPDLPTLSAIGYRECIGVLQGRLEVPEAIARIKRSTRAFVRRQANWFKSDDPTIHWFDAGQTPIDEMETYVRTILYKR